MRPIMVTGAAGTIGSEVCRLLVSEGRQVVAVDVAETPLFWLHRELGERVVPVIGSVTDINFMVRVARDWGVDAVIHAAALKHVGMCERNILAAIETNVLGTQRTCMAAAAAGARMVLVSTDKAVHPTTVMGATKRIAELIVSRQENARIVRLVNIWGSNGSLVPVVKDAIAKGGPVMLAHPDASRFFMEADEAARLIVQAMTSPYSADAEVLIPAVEHRRMRIADVIKDLIGDRSIAVEIGGLLPAEKLHENMATGAEYKMMVDGRFPIPRWHGKMHQLSKFLIMAEPQAASAELFKLAGESQ